MNINISFAKSLVSCYGQNHWQLVNNTFGMLISNPLYPNVKDTRCVWFSIADLTAFLAEIQPETGTPATGVRIYFGEYSHDTLQDAPNTYIPGLATLLMIPTRTNALGKEEDFDVATGSSDFSALTTVTALNHGDCTPPPYRLTGVNNMYEQGNGFMRYADDHF